MTAPEQKYPIIRADMQMRKGKESNITSTTKQKTCKMKGRNELRIFETRRIKLQLLPSYYNEYNNLNSPTKRHREST